MQTVSFLFQIWYSYHRCHYVCMINISSKITTQMNRMTNTEQVLFTLYTHAHIHLCFNIRHKASQHEHIYKAFRQVDVIFILRIFS